ncbi:MAG: GNAT family N-acetyltransferase [Planctomycetota bacterium]|nr:GNAT family N-acetyltransferase [Planctomycetota bacterium]
MGNVSVRSIREGDVERIINIDLRVTGEEKAGFWRGMLGAYLLGKGDLRDALAPSLCQVAEIDGRVVGFMVGDIQSYQFGIPRCGRIVTVGVDPDHRRQGIASHLARAIFDEFRRFNAPKVQCLVAPEDPLSPFFRSIGFEPTPLLSLEKPLK